MFSDSINARALRGVRRNPMARPRRVWKAALVGVLALITAAAIAPRPLHAQDQMDSGADGGGSMSLAPLPGANGSSGDANGLPPMPKVRILQPINASMMVAPPYGTSPLQVGFFVLADDPEGFGFLTYSWNFGDGTVSSLPPELYIYHTYQNPGTYVCSLVLKTVDGRAMTLMQGVTVAAPAD